MNDLLLHGLRDLYGNDIIDYPGCWYFMMMKLKKENMMKNDFGVRVSQ